MLRLSDEVKIRILEEYKRIGYKPTKIASNIHHFCGYNFNPTTIGRFIEKFEQSTCIKTLEGQGRPTLITDDLLQIVHDSLKQNDETPMTQIKKKLREKGHFIS